MNAMNNNSSLLLCSICFTRPTAPEPLVLTSCAHFLCGHHILGEGANRGVSSSQLQQSYSCKKCGESSVSIADVTAANLSSHVAQYIAPLDRIGDELASVLKFQQATYASTVTYFQEKLNDYESKFARQNNLLQRVETELKEARHWREKCSRLEHENTNLKRQVSKEDVIVLDPVQSPQYKAAKMFIDLSPAGPKKLKLLKRKSVDASCIQGDERIRSPVRSFTELSPKNRIETKRSPLGIVKYQFDPSVGQLQSRSLSRASSFIRPDFPSSVPHRSVSAAPGNSHPRALPRFLARGGDGTGTPRPFVSSLSPSPVKPVAHRVPFHRL